jgi:cytochrome c
MVAADHGHSHRIRIGHNRRGPRRPRRGEDLQRLPSLHEIADGAKNEVGPALNAVVGHKSGSYPGYNYSGANKNSGLIWDEATLQEYFKNPKAKVPGTKMPFPGLKGDDDIVNVIAFLKHYGSETK